MARPRADEVGEADPPEFSNTIVGCTFAPFGMNTCRSCVHAISCHVCEVSDSVYTALPFASVLSFSFQVNDLSSFDT